MEYKHFKIKSFDEEKGVFEGYCAVKGNIDNYGDIILDGAFEQAEGKTFPILFMHDPSKPIGVSTFVKEDQHGLYTRGQLDLDTELGRMVYSGLRKKYIDCMSIGYTVDEDDMNKKGNRLLKKISLLEYSLITKNFAANSQAMVSGFKYSQYKDDSEGESMDSIYDGAVEEDMKRMKRMHERLRDDHEELRDAQEHMKRRHKKLEKMVKECMSRMSDYDRDDDDDDIDYDYFGKSDDAEKLNKVTKEESHDEDPFFFKG